MPKIHMLYFIALNKLRTFQSRLFYVVYSYKANWSAPHQIRLLDLYKMLYLI